MNSRFGYGRGRTSGLMRALVCVTVAAALGLPGGPARAQVQANAHARAQAHAHAKDQGGFGSGTTLLTETFRGVDASEFIGFGKACLTGAAPVPANSLPSEGDHPLGGCEPGTGEVPPANAAPHGYLRLTDAGPDRSAAVLYNHALPANGGLDVTFDAWQYGNLSALPADGISFFLTDGATRLTHPGAFGGSLGYAKKQPGGGSPNPPSFVHGVEGGYLGVGMDVLGNYFGDTEQRGYSCEDQPSPAGPPDGDVLLQRAGPNMITLRGPGNGINGYCYITATTNYPHTVPPGGGPWPSALPGTLQGSLAAFTPPVTPESAQTQLEPSRRHVNVRLSPVTQETPTPQLTVTVDFEDGTGPHTVLNIPAPMPVPPTYKFGFAASTGFFNDVHLIRNVTIASEHPLPELNLVKQVREPRPQYLREGEQVHYEFVVTNAGVDPIDDLEVNDPTVGPVSCPMTKLEPKQTVTCTATYTVTEADVARGNVANTAIATGEADGEPVESPPSSERVPAEGPGVSIVKEVAEKSFTGPGTPLHYTYTVRNTGTVELHDVRVTDPHVPGLVCGPFTLPPSPEPGWERDCEGVYVTNQDDVDAGKVTNVATVRALEPDGTELVDTDTVTVPEHAPSLSVEKSAFPRTYAAVGQEITYTYRVVNTGNVVLHGVHVVDSEFGRVDCAPASLDPGEDAECTHVYAVTQADLNRGSIFNSATAHGTGPQGEDVPSRPAEETVTAAHAPGISVEKSAFPDRFSAVGQEITYTYRVVNTGNVVLRGVHVTDSQFGTVACAPQVLQPGEEAACEHVYAVTQADLNAGSVTNAATAHGTGPNDEDVPSVPDTETVTAEHAPSLSVEKSAFPRTYAAVGQEITYTYRVVNTGNVVLHGVHVVDSEFGRVDCAPASLDPGEDAECTHVYAVTQADLNRGSIANAATAHGTGPEGDVPSEPAEETVTAEHAPSLELEKTSEDLFFSEPGTVLHYTYHVVNTGNVALYNVVVHDDKAELAGCSWAVLPPGSRVTCTGTYTTTPEDVDVGGVTNTAYAAGVLPDRTTPERSEEDAVTVPHFEMPSMSITKTAQEQSFSEPGTTLHYTYTVTNTGNVALHQVTVTDPHVPDLVCGPFDLQPAPGPGDQETCHGTYVTTAADVTAGGVTNVATVNATGPEGPLPPQEAQATVPSVRAHPVARISVTKSAKSHAFTRAGQVITYTYQVTNTGNVRLHDVTVTDSKIGAVSCPHRTLEPGESMTCTASYTVTAADVHRGYVDNTATAAGTAPNGAVVREQKTRSLPFTGVRPAPPRPAPVPPITKIPVRVTG